MRREVLTARTYRAIGDEKSALAANGATDSHRSIAAAAARAEEALPHGRLQGAAAACRKPHAGDKNQ